MSQKIHMSFIPLPLVKLNIFISKDEQPSQIGLLEKSIFVITKVSNSRKLKRSNLHDI